MYLAERWQFFFFSCCPVVGKHRAKLREAVKLMQLSQWVKVHTWFLLPEGTGQEVTGCFKKNQVDQLHPDG